MTRTASIHRTTAETDVRITLDIEGVGKADIATGVGMYDHLLTSFATHGMFDLTVATVGDLHIDEHHTVEDTAIGLGAAFDQALGDRSGIRRFADARVPMDEALASAAIDLGGRAHSTLDLPFLTPTMGALGTQMIPHALEAFVANARMTLHLHVTGRNDHHMAEAAFKSLAVAMRAACAIDPRRDGVPSSKGVL